MAEVFDVREEGGNVTIVVHGAVAIMNHLTTMLDVLTSKTGGSASSTRKRVGTTSQVSETIIISQPTEERGDIADIVNEWFLSVKRGFASQAANRLSEVAPVVSRGVLAQHAAGGHSD